MSPSIREGDAWPRVVMADLEEGEIEEGELPVTQPEVRQPSRIVLNFALPWCSVLLNPRDHTSAGLHAHPDMKSLLRLPAGFAGAAIHSSKPVTRA